jgi:8-oxo-dGTP pyrophosphatase MutT (NUDIX family)
MGETRRAARVLLIDGDGSVLLLFGRDPSVSGSGWWLTPGGGIEGDESLIDAAIREVFEETGCRLHRVDGPVGTREIRFTFEGEDIHQFETYFAARVDRFDIDRSGWTDLEQRSMSEFRWWTRSELKTTSDSVYPENLLAMLETAEELSA